MKTLIIRHYTGPLFTGGVEFGWREVEGGPVDWFNNTGLDEAEIQRQLQEYRQVCGFEFEVEDQRRADEGVRDVANHNEKRQATSKLASKGR